MRTFARVLRMLRRPGRWKRRRGRLVTVELDGLPADLPPDPRRPWVVLDVHVRGGSVGQVFERAPEGLTGARQLELVATRLGGPAAHRAVRMALRDALTGGTPENAGPIPPVSVVICTRDRPDDLAVCLSATARLDPPPLEVIVVDNAPGSEATSDLCAAHPGVVHVVEPVPGLCRARNRGIAVARGAWVAFTDDDCVPEPDWLAPLAAAARDPLVSAVCGHALPLEVEAPSQYLFEAHGGFERHPDRWVHDPIAHPPHGVAFTAGAGANMILRRDALLAIGGFRADTGPGSAAPLSDEKEVFLRLALAGHRLVHDPASRVRHRHRREPELLRSTLRSYGRSEVAFALYAAARHRAWRGLATPRWWVRHSLGDLRSSVRDRPRSVPARLALEELGGMLEGPAAAWRALRTPPVPLPPAAEPAALERIEVGAEAPAVSVALATHQRRESVVETLRGLAQQTLAPERFEVVVVVDGSTDGTAAAVRELALPFGLRVHEQANRGLAATRNVGAALAAHPLVVFLDDDIRPDPDWLAAHATRHAEAGDRVVLGIYPPRLPGPGSDWWTQAVAAWWADHFRRKLEPGHRWTLLDVIDGNLSLPRRVFDAVGRFDEGFRGGRRQDHELGVRLLAQGIPLVAEPRAFGWHDFDTRLETGLRNASEEGLYDVRIARMHPAVVHQLPLGGVRVDELASGARPRTATTLARLRALERADLRRAWADASAGAMRRAYVAGVREALGGEAAAALAALLAAAPPPEPVEVRLDGVGSFRAAVPPGRQWDVDGMVDLLLESNPSAVGLPSALRRPRAER